MSAASVQVHRVKVIDDAPCIKDSVQAEAAQADVTMFTMNKTGQLLDRVLREQVITGVHIPIADHWYCTTAGPSLEFKKLVLPNGGTVSFSNLEIDPPMHNGYILTPQRCREEGLSYASDWHMTMTLEQPERPPQTHRIKVGSIPIMTYSTLCVLRGKTPQQLTYLGEDPNDVRGIWIHKGKEKVILSYEHLILNKMIIMKTISSEPEIIRMTISMPNSTRLMEMKTKNGIIKLLVPSIKSVKQKTRINKSRSINVLWIYYWLGFTSQQQINEHVADFIESDDPVYIKICLLELTDNIAEVSVISKIDEDKQRILDDDGNPIPDQNAYLTRKIRRDDVTVEQYTDTDLDEVKALIFNNDIFPQLNDLVTANGTTELAKKEYITNAKLDMLSRMLAQYCEHNAGLRDADDRNLWGNKRIEGGPRVAENLVRNSWRTTLEKVQLEINKSSDNKYTDITTVATKIDQFNVVNSSIDASMTSGNLGVKNRGVKTNMVQTLNNNNPADRAGHVLQCKIAVASTSKDKRLRQADGSQYGFIDYIDTPDGDSVGHDKKLGITVMLTRERSDVEVIDQVRHLFTNVRPRLQPEDLKWRDNFIVFGKFLGWCDGPVLRQELLNLRRQQLIHFETTVVYEKRPKAAWGTVFVDVGPSRPIRPVLIVNIVTQRLVIDEKQLWGASINQLMAEQAMEYISPWEQEYAMIATELSMLAKQERLKAENDAMMLASGTRNSQTSSLGVPNSDSSVTRNRYNALNDYTHCEMDPKTMMGLISSVIIWANHNQSPRNTYQDHMIKQLMCAYPNWQHEGRFRDKRKVLIGGVRPMAVTQSYDLIDFNRKGTGVNMLLCFAAIPETEEDSFVMCRESRDFGTCRYRQYTVYKTSVMDKSDTRYELARPKLKHGDDANRYKFIGENGLPYEGAELREEDCVIGRIMGVKQNDVIVNERNTSVYIKVGEYGIVDKVRVFADNSGKSTAGYNVVVTMRVTKNVKHGDKEAGRYAQKGTNGRFEYRYNMFYEYTTGLSPDIYQNVHSMPSRMTLAQIFEQYMSKRAAFEGRVIDCSPFAPIDILHTRDVLERYGRDPNGYETMYSGLSGARLHGADGLGSMNMGPVSMQMLLHLAENKEHARGRGGYKPENRQPNKGRADNGGPKFGEMERDALISYGVAHNVLGRTMLLSDAYDVYFCQKCHNYAVFRDTSQSGGVAAMSCDVCRQKEFGWGTIPYVWKWFKHMWLAMGVDIGPRLDRPGIKQDYRTVSNKLSSMSYTERNRLASGVGEELDAQTIDVDNGGEAQPDQGEVDDMLMTGDVEGVWD